MNFADWLQTLPGAPTPTQAATKSRLASPTLIRHAERGHTTADNIIKIARAFNVSPVDALVDNGFLCAAEIDRAKVTARQALHDLGIDEALRTVVERVNASGLFAEDFTTKEVVDDLAEHRSVLDADDGTVREFDYAEYEYAADSSASEQEARYERGEDPID